MLPAIDALQAQLEFKRRKLALKTAQTYRSLRSDGCTFDEMLELTNPLKRTDVIEQYCTEQELSQAKREQLLRIAAGSTVLMASPARTARARRRPAPPRNIRWPTDR